MLHIAEGSSGRIFDRDTAEIYRLLFEASEFGVRDCELACTIWIIKCRIMAQWVLYSWIPIMIMIFETHGITV